MSKICGQNWTEEFMDRIRRQNPWVELVGRFCWQNWWAEFMSKIGGQISWAPLKWQISKTKFKWKTGDDILIHNSKSNSWENIFLQLF